MTFLKLFVITGIKTYIGLSEAVSRHVATIWTAQILNINKSSVSFIVIIVLVNSLIY